MPRTCGFCKRPNARHPNARYCSRQCKQRAYSARKLEVRRQARQGGLFQFCEHCGNTVESNLNGRARFCSKECRTRWHNDQRSAARAAARPARSCERCSSPIPAERRIGAKYCTDGCKKLARDARWRVRASGYNRQYLYGVTPEQWQAKWDDQDGRCAICRVELVPGAKTTHAEHDHVTGAFCGITCDRCNLGLGHFRHDPVLLRAAADYAERTRLCAVT